MAISRQKTAATTFSIITPDLNQVVIADQANTVFVQVLNRDTANNRFQATITDIASGTVVDTQDLAREGSSNLWSNRVGAGLVPGQPPSGNNKTVAVQAFQGAALGDQERNDFATYRTGSGSAVGIIAQNRCGFCSATPAVPVCLQLINHGGGITNIKCDNCAALNTDVFLQHSNDGSLSCCWFSAPINFCGADSGYWKLQKIDAMTWQLRFFLNSQGIKPIEIVSYTCTTATANDCSFPLELGFGVQSVTDACGNWPASITVAPAT